MNVGPSSSALPNAPEGDRPAGSAEVVPRLFVLIVTVVFCLVCAAPYVIAASRAPGQTRFTGVLLNHFDQAYYRAAQRSTARALPHANRFTAEPAAPGPGPPLYPVLGHIERLTGLPAAAVYHLPRVLAVVALPVLLANLFGLCFPTRREAAMWAVLFALFAAGALTLAPSLAIARRSGERIPESNVLYSLTVFPHFAISYVGLALAFTALAMALRRQPKLRIAAVAAVAGILLGLGHSFLLLPFLAVVSAFALVAAAQPVLRGGRASGMSRLAATGVVIIPAAPFLFVLHRSQNRLEDLQGSHFPTARPDQWWTWAIGFGIVSLLAIAGAASLFRSSKGDPLTWMLLAWVGAQAAFIYLPSTPFQRRYSEGLILPLAGLAGAGIAHIAGSARTGLALRGGVGVVLAVGALGIVDTLGVSGQYESTELAALARGVRVSDVVLAGQSVSAVLPAISDATSHAARPVETIRYRAKRRAATRYGSDPASAASKQWLLSEGITMVVVSRKDPSFTLRRPDGVPGTCLARILHGPDLSAYRVQSSCLRRT